MKRILAHRERCVGCKSCELACAIQHSQSKNLFGAMAESLTPRKRIFVEEVDEERFVIKCNHCDDAPCVNSCISGCLYKDENGYTRREKERCIGCWSCVMACPFGVITRDPRLNIAVKCDGCHKLDTPACVTACPTKTLEMVDIDELPAAARREAALAEQNGR